jgi:hypothetical protein
MELIFRIFFIKSPLIFLANEVNKWLTMTIDIYNEKYQNIQLYIYVLKRLRIFF